MFKERFCRAKRLSHETTRSNVPYRVLKSRTGWCDVPTQSCDELLQVFVFKSAVSRADQRLLSLGVCRRLPQGKYHVNTLITATTTSCDILTRLSLIHHLTI
jgi:hypothetical protein